MSSKYFSSFLFNTVFEKFKTEFNNDFDEFKRNLHILIQIYQVNCKEEVNIFKDFIQYLNNLFIKWKPKCLYFLFYINSNEDINNISSNFNVDIYVTDKDSLKHNFFLQFEISLCSNNKIEYESTKSIGWIDLPFFKSQTEVIENIQTDEKRVLFANDVISLPFCWANFQTQFKRIETDSKIKTKIYVCLQAKYFTNKKQQLPRKDEQSKRLISKFVVCQLIVTSNETFVSSLNDLIFVKCIDLKITDDSSARLEIKLQSSKTISVENFSPALINKGFNHHQIFILNYEKIDSQIFFSCDNEAYPMESFNIFERCLVKDQSFCTAFYLGKKKTLNTSNARLELPDLSNIQTFKPKIISIKRIVNFSECGNDIIIENGLDCSPDGDLNFTAKLYIKRISKSDDIEFINSKKNITRMENSHEILVEINHFSKSIIKERLKKEKKIEIAVDFGLRRFATGMCLVVYLSFKNHLRVRHKLKFMVLQLC